MKRLLLIFSILTLLLVTAFAPLPQMDQTWRGVLETVVMVVLFLIGAPLTQFLKNALRLKDELAVLFTGLVAFVIAIAEVFLSGVLTLEAFSIDNLPFAFTTVFTVATFYYNLLKESPTVFGKKGLLPKLEPEHDQPIP